MAFLRSGILSDGSPVVRAKRLYLRLPQMSDYGAWAELRAMSRDHLVPWEPEWSRHELTRYAFRRRIRYYQREVKDDLGYAFFLFREGDDALLGGLTLNNVRRGVTQSAAVGYWLGKPYIGSGYMTEALLNGAVFAFEELNLHRLEAACLPHNRASMAVLERCGFKGEGLARRYLKINGAWQDHLLFALLSDDPRPGDGAA